MSSESDCNASTEGLSVFQGDSDDDADNVIQTDVNEHSETKLSKEDNHQLQSSPEHTKSLKANPHTFLEPLEEMFYLPKREVVHKLYSVNQSAGSLETILSNVKHLLSRSPPKNFDLHCSLILNEPAHFDESDEICSSLREEVDHFHVNFDLEEDENSLDSDSLDCNVAGTPPVSETLPSEHVSAGPDSPSWDEVFDDVADDGEDENTNLPLESKIQPTNLDESVDLFGDDDAFLQISLPHYNIVTPNRQDTDQRKQVTQNVGDASNSSENAEASSKSSGQKPPSQKRSEAFNYSQDMYSVNFDLGFSFDSEEEETTEQALDMTTEPTADRRNTFTSLTLNKPNISSNNFTLGHMSTPRVCPMDKELPSLIAKSNLSPIITERESLIRPNTSTPTLAFVSPKNRNLELFPKVLSSQAQPHGTGNRLCRRSLLDAQKPVHEDHACSGKYMVFNV